MSKLAAVVLLLAGCSSRSTLVMLGGGTTKAVGDGLAEDTGVALQGVVGDGGPGMQVSFRRADDTQELALGVTLFTVGGGSDNLLDSIFNPFRSFMRVGANLIEWDRVGTDDGAGFGGLTLEIGVGTYVGGCLSASASRDFRFNDRDDTFLGLTFSACALAE